MSIFSALRELASRVQSALSQICIPCLLHGSRVKGMDAAAADAAIAQAMKDAVSVLEKRINELDAWDEQTRRSFSDFFGTEDEETRAAVKLRMKKTRDHIKGMKPENFRPDDDAFGYVYSDDDAKMYLGELFADAPATGRDSRAGTLIHEASHYNSVAGSGDVVHDGHIVYGEAGAKQLAKDDPAKALENADNLEYFVEDGF